MDIDKQNMEDSVDRENKCENQSLPKGSNTTLLEFIDKVADRFEPLVKLFESYARNSLKSRQADSNFRIHMAWIAVVVVILIVGVATFLTFTGKMDGSTFGFLLGLIMGYVLTFGTRLEQRSSSEHF